jgi:hypothetical protein
MKRAGTEDGENGFREVKAGTNSQGVKQAKTSQETLHLIIKRQ